jgi:hypothetical protein
LIPTPRYEGERFLKFDFPLGFLQWLVQGSDTVDTSVLGLNDLEKKEEKFIIIVVIIIIIITILFMMMMMIIVIVI